MIASLQPQMAPHHGQLLLAGGMAIASGFTGFLFLFRTAPKAPLVPSHPGPTRQFLDPTITPLDLAEKIIGRTSVQIDSLTSTYKDKWMTVTGSVNDVTHIFGPKWAVHMRDRSDDRLAFVCFQTKLHEQLFALRPGDVITVNGRIDSLKNGLSLEDGELVHVGGPWPRVPEDIDDSE